MAMKISAKGRQSIMSGGYVLQLLCSLVVGISLSSYTNGLPSGQADVAGLNVSSAFGIVLLPEVHIPIDSEEVYRTAAGMMVQVTDRPLMEAWRDRDWKSPVGNSGIYIRHNKYGRDPSRLYTQYIIWGLNYLLLSMTLTGRYCQITAMLSYRGLPVGTIHIATQSPVGEFRSAQEPRASVASDLGSVASDDFEIRVSYGPRPLPKNVVYLTAIQAMGEACEKGLSAAVPGMFTVGLQLVTWKLLPMPQHERVIKAGYSRMAVIKTLARMALDQQFLEAFVWVKVDGHDAGIGGFTQAGLNLNATS
ncbi:MAG: hypothetical protein Q9192_004252 [Flavoplaca navasiana]